jgi:manganese/iron transport system permease protein
MRTIIDSFHSPFFQRAAIEAVLVGALSGVVGVHVLLRRLPFFVVAMSHATFPGVVLASILGISIFLGGTAFGLIVVLAVVALGSVRALDDSSAIGVVLAGSFAIGVLMLSSRRGASKDLSAFLVGQILTVTTNDILTTVIVATVLLGILAALHKELVHGAFDPAGQRALGYSAATLNLVVLTVVTTAMVMSVPAVGTLLSVALLTVPALAARQWVDRVGPMMVLSAVLGASCGMLGLCFSALWDIAAGGAIALTATALFIISALVRSPLSPFARRSAQAGPPVS